MDDNTFDDLLKRKLKNYEDQSIDPFALDDFQGRMSNFKTTRWYSRHAAAIALAASLLMFTGINAYILVKNLNTQERTNIVYLPNDKLNQNKIDSLLSVIDQIQCKALDRPAFISDPASPKFTLRLVKVSDNLDPSSTDFTYKIGIGSRKNIPENVYSQLEREGLVANENDEVFLLLSKSDNSENQTALHVRSSDLLIPTPQPGTLRIIALNDNPTERKKSVHTPPEGKSSLAARNALEKHYFNKLGIQVGVHGDLMKGFFTQGTGAVTPRIGLTADWVLTPRISLESGFDYGTTETRFSGGDIPRVPYNQQLGNLESATITNRLLSVPLSIKYRQWVADKSQFILRAGYTPYGIISKEIQYNYVRPDINPDDSNGDRISTIDKRDENKFFGGTITGSAGLIINRKESKNLWEASLFYEHGLGNGFEKSNMQLVGLRTAYWLKIK